MSQTCRWHRVTPGGVSDQGTGSGRVPRIGARVWDTVGAVRDTPGRVEGRLHAPERAPVRTLEATVAPHVAPGVSDPHHLVH